MWQKTKMNQNTAGRVVVVEKAQRAPMKDKREEKTQKRKTLQIKRTIKVRKQIFEEKVKKETGEKQKRGESTGEIRQERAVRKTLK